MKKTFVFLSAVALGLLTMVSCGDDDKDYNDNAQVLTAKIDLTPEEEEFQQTLQQTLAEGLISFNNSVTEEFENSSSYEEFKSNLCGNKEVTPIGESILVVSYNYLAAGYSEDYILANYDGLEMRDALVYLLEHPNSDGSELFGFLDKASTPCAHWYSIGCHLRNALNATEQWMSEHKTLVDTLVKVLIALIPKLIK
jgi:hypothetical protein